MAVKIFAITSLFQLFRGITEIFFILKMAKISAMSEFFFFLNIPGEGTMILVRYGRRVGPVCPVQHNLLVWGARLDKHL